MPLLAVLWLCCAPGAFAASAADHDRAASAETPGRVIVWNRTIAILRVPLLGKTPEQRAEGASARLDAMFASRPGDSIEYQLVKGEIGDLVLIGNGPQVLFGLAAGDLPQGTATTLDAAGKQITAQLTVLLGERNEQRRWPILLRGLAEAALATLAALALGLGILRGRRWVIDRMVVFSQRRMAHLVHAGLDARNYVLLFFRWLVHASTFTLVAAAGYVSLAFILSRFVYTRPWSDELGNMLLSSLGRIGAGIARAIPDLITLAVIILIARWTAQIADRWFRAIERGDAAVAWLDPDASRVTRRLVLIVIWMFAITVAFPYIPGSSTDAFKGVSLFLGLVISLGATGVVGQIVSGLFVVFNRAMRPGDFIRVGQVEGTVIELGTTAVRLLTSDKKEVIVPNAVLVSNSIENFSRHERDAVLVTTQVTIGYDTPWRQVQAMLMLAAERTPGVLRDPMPQVVKSALSDYYVEYLIIAYAARKSARGTVLSRLRGEILDTFNEFDVQIMSPHFKGQPVEPVIVPKSRWFQSPAIEEKLDE
ncbi:MAG: mechanosensitive ion channel domain-containing protein [Betaproteobacteria bacterium]